MANSPGYAATPVTGSVLVPATLDTSTTAPTNTANVLTGGASGTRIDIVRIVQVASTAAAGLVNLFLFDGTTHHLWDFFSFGVNTLNTTTEFAPADFPYPELYLPTSSWILRCTVTVAAGQSAFKVHAIGGNF